MDEECQWNDVQGIYTCRVGWIGWGKSEVATNTKWARVRFFIHLPMKMEPIRSSETSAIKTRTPENYPKRKILQLKNGENLKTRLNFLDSFFEKRSNVKFHENNFSCGCGRADRHEEANSCLQTKVIGCLKFLEQMNLLIREQHWLQ